MSLFMVNLVESVCWQFLDFLGQVTVSTKSAKSDKQYVWEGEADTSVYTICEETDSDKLLPRGTVITLHLKVFSEQVHQAEFE
jgi:HSP90 family molecular chaperone